jgi:putative ABC transport system permease protein
MWTYVRSQLRYRRRRAVGVAGAVALGAALFIVLTALGDGFREAARAPLADTAADLVVTRPLGEQAASAQRTRGVRAPFGQAALTPGDIDKIRAVPGVTDTARALQLWDFGSRATTTITGVDLAARNVGPARLLDRGITQGRALRSGDSAVAVLDLHYASFYGLKVGAEVTVGETRIPVVGIVTVQESSQAAVSNIYLPLADAQRLAGLPPGETNQLHAQVGEAADTEAIAARIEDTAGPVSIVTADSIVQLFGAVGRVSSRFSLVAAIVGVIGGLVLTWLTLRALLAERVKEIGILKAVGWQRRDVVRAFRLEALVLSGTGAVAGVLLGLALTALLSFVPVPELPSLGSAADGHGMEAAHEPAADATLPITVSPLNVGIALLAGAGGGTLAGAFAARRIAALRPAKILVTT